MPSCTPPPQKKTPPLVEFQIHSLLSVPVVILFLLTPWQLCDDVAIEEWSENQTLSSGIPVEIRLLKMQGIAILDI